MPNLNLNNDDLIEILDEENEDYEVVKKSEIVEQTRWSTYFQKILLRKSDQTYWCFSWSRGSTELQDDGIQDLEAWQVTPVQQTITVYEDVK